MKKMFLFLTMLLMLANVKWASAVDEIDIGLYATSCSSFEVRLSSQDNITGTSLTNVQFAVKYPASVTLGNLTYPYPVGLQYTTTVGADKYSVFIGVDVPISNWASGVEYTVVTFGIDHADAQNIALVIGDDAWTAGNNTMYYAELLGLDKTGDILYGASVYLGAHNIDLGRYYCKIQEAIDDAGTGGETIEVYSGTYFENVIINKTGLTVQNALAASPVVDGSNTGNVVTISANNINFQGFTVQNSGSTVMDVGIILRNDGTGGVTGCSVTGNIIAGNPNGLGVVLGSGNSVISNEIHNCSEYGILLIGTGNDTIVGNSVYDIAKDAIALDNLAALTGNPAHVTIGSSDNYLEANTIYNIDRDGIFIGGYCDDNEITGGNDISSITSIGIHVWRNGSQVITDNIIYNASVGIKLRGSDNSVITGNTITLNNIGIEIEKYFLGGIWYLSQNNTIKNNEIADNITYGMKANNNDNVVVDATENWWGHASGPYNDPYNTCGQGNEVIGSVAFMPWWANEAMTIQGTLPVYNQDKMTYYCKIQDAIDDASEDNTIVLSAGDYYESDITIDVKGLILVGDGQTTTFIRPDPLKVDDGTCDPTSGTAHHGIVIAADEVTITDLTVDGGDPDRGYRMGITSYYWTGQYFDITTIQDVTVTNIHYRGIVLRRNGAVTNGHTIERTTVTNGGCDEQGWAILGFNANVDIIDCYVENWEQGIGTGNYAGIPSTCKIEGNEVVDVQRQAYTTTRNGPLSTFDDNKATFINPANTGKGLVTYQCEMVITNNTFTGAKEGISVGYQTLAKDKLVIGAGNVITGPGTGVSGSSGIIATDNAWGGVARNFTVNGTTISGYETGIKVLPVNGMTTDADINNNKIFDNGKGLINDYAGLIDATLNWWGHATGPYNDPYNTCGQGNAVEGNVAFMPWCADEDCIGEGTLPVYNQDKMTYYCKIQDAIDDASEDNTIVLSAGDYYESDITIDVKGLILEGDGQTTTFIRPDPLKVDDGTCHPTNGTVHHGIVIAADEVTIRDITVDGGVGKGYRMGITTYYWTGLNYDYATIEDVTVTNIHYRGIVFRRNGALTTGHKLLRSKVTEGGCDFAQSYAILGFNATDFEVDDCFVENWSMGIATGGGLDKTASITNNTVKDVGFIAYTLTHDVTIGTEESVFDNNTVLFTTPDYWQTGILVYRSEVELTNNIINGAHLGITIGRQDLDKSKLVIGNGNVITGPGTTFPWSVGIDVSDWGWEGYARNFTMTGTTVTNYETGVWFDPVFGMTSDALINGNKIFDNGVGLQNDLGTVIDASENWWGHATGPNRLSDNTCGLGNGVSDDVEICNWYTNVAMTPADLNGCVILIFNVTGGGEYCSGGAGLEVGLDDSETGVNYQLYLSGNPVGSPVAGDGDDITFGYQTLAGTYTVKATNTYTGCADVLMNGSAVVIINPLPDAPTAGNVTVVYDGNLHIGSATAPVGASVVWYDAPVGGNVLLYPPSGTNVGVYTAWAESVDNLTGCVSAVRTEVTVTITPVTVGLTVMLQGPYAGGGVMNTDLFGQIPSGQPYSVAPWNYGGGENETPPVNAVDWILVELRSDPNTMVGRAAGILNDDGTIAIGIDDLTFPGVVAGSAYYIVVWHRNHMPVMSKTAQTVPVTSYDFTVLGNLYGTNPAIDLGGGVYGMIAGDVTKNGMLKYSGPNNDRGPIIARIVQETGSNNINGQTAPGYWQEDVNMNSIVLYLGSGNDRAIIPTNLLALTGNSYLNNTYTSQVPGAYFGGKKSTNEGPVDIRILETGQLLAIEIFTNQLINNGMVDNIQFTLAWKADDKEIGTLLGSLTSSFNLLPQGETVEVGGINYLVFVSVTPAYLPLDWDKEESVTVLSFEKSYGQSFLNRLWIAEDSQSGSFNGEFYVSNWGTDFTGMIMGAATGLVTPEAAQIQLFPNPVSSGQLYMKVNGVQNENLVTEIWDMTGKLVQKYEEKDISGAMTVTIDVSQLRTGVYLINVIGNKVLYQDRFIVK